MRTTEMVLFAPFLKTSKFIPACISIYILSLFINLPRGQVRFHTKFGPDWFSRFDVSWIRTNPDRQAKFKYRWWYQLWILSVQDPYIQRWAYSPFFHLVRSSFVNAEWPIFFIVQKYLFRLFSKWSFIFHLLHSFSTIVK